MKILFSADLHGRTHYYKDLFDLAIFKSVDVILIGGDLLPTKIAEPLRLIFGNFDFNKTLLAQYDFIDKQLTPMCEEFRKRSPKTRMFYVPGNHDWLSSIKYLEKKIPYLKCIHNKKEIFDGISIIGYGCVTDSAFWVKDFVRKDMKNDPALAMGRYLCGSKGNTIISHTHNYLTSKPCIEEDLSSFTIDHPSKTIALFHCPPFDTYLDILFNSKPVGSKAIRKFIEDKKPGISLHGHIHESPYVSNSFFQNIGPTLAINPGQDASQLHAVIFDATSPEKTLSHTIFDAKGPIYKSFLRSKKNRIAARIKSRLIKMILKREKT